MVCYKPTIRSDLLPLPANFPQFDDERQDTGFASAFLLLQEAVQAHAFPACSLAVMHRGRPLVLKSIGKFTFDADSPEVTDSCLFDIASVTKVVATTAMAMILYERGLLDLDTPAVAIIPEFASSADLRRNEVTLRMLLAHSSGLPAYVKLFLHAKTPQALLAAAFDTELTAKPGTRAEYSDIGFIILGVALARIADEPLDLFCQREILGPLGLVNTTFNPAVPLRANCVPSANDLDFRHRIIQGEVQDENASVLGGVAGHAGLFSTARDISLFSLAMLSTGNSILRRETVSLFTSCQGSPPGTSRGLGWDTPSAPSQAGRHFSSHSFGHLGYTGTSLWIDPEQDLSITLLTNRTWPDCKNQAIRQVRPKVHDAIVEALEK
jgi:serine-type D-Ala-D-Ala carboxypeptidase